MNKRKHPGGKRRAFSCSSFVWGGRSRSCFLLFLLHVCLFLVVISSPSSSSSGHTLDFRLDACTLSTSHFRSYLLGCSSILLHALAYRNCTHLPVSLLAISSVSSHLLSGPRPFSQGEGGLTRSISLVHSRRGNPPQVSLLLHTATSCDDGRHCIPSLLSFVHTFLVQLAKQNKKSFPSSLLILLG